MSGRSGSWRNRSGATKWADRRAARARSAPAESWRQGCRSSYGTTCRSDCGSARSREGSPRQLEQGGGEAAEQDDEGGLEAIAPEEQEGAGGDEGGGGVDNGDAGDGVGAGDEQAEGEGGEGALEGGQPGPAA